MKKQIVMALALCSAHLIFAMESQDRPKLTQEEQNRVDNALISAIERGSIKQVREAIMFGANANSHGGVPLSLAVKKLANYHIVKILLESNAEVNERILQQAEEAGWFGAHLYTLLAHIPSNEQKKIREKIPGFHTGSLAILRQQPQLPRDVRNMIKQILIDDLVQEQMHRIIALVARVQSLRYLSNQLNYKSEEYEKLRKAVKNNIKRILYGAPKQ